MSTTAGDLLALMWAPFLMCLVLTGIHAYLGIHVIAREVVFVDIALAQIAALGAAAALLVDVPIESPVAYAAGLGATCWARRSSPSPGAVSDASRRRRSSGSSTRSRRRRPCSWWTARPTGPSISARCSSAASSP